MKAKDNDKGSYDPIPEDRHLARCTGVIDLGTQHNTKYDKYERKCLLCFELPEVRAEFEKEDGTKVNAPRFISRRFTLSLGSNSHLRKFLRTWRGRDFTPEELKGFEMKNLLNQPAILQVLHDKSADGSKVYSNVDNASRPMKGQTVPEAESECVYFSFDEVKDLAQADEVTDDLPEWIQKLIQKSVEYSDLAKKSGVTAPVGDTPAMPDPDDDVPF